MTKNSYNKFLPFFMWSIPLLFFAHQFILRLWPGLMMQQIITQFNIDATMFGALAASYYYGYAGMQIPVAILLDKYGARKIVSIFAIICGLGMIIFTYTNNFYVALVSRFFIGVGSAVGFLGISKVLSEWFDKKAYTRMVGFSFSFGLMGAVYGGKPVGLLVEEHSPSNVAFSIGVVSISIGVAAYLFLKSPALNKESHEEELEVGRLKAVLSSKLIWVVAISNLLLVGALEGFADVWGVQYLVTCYEMVKSDAAGVVSLIFVGMLVGGPILAWFSEKYGEAIVIGFAGFIMSIIFILLLSDVITKSLLPYFFFIVGVMCCYQVLVFAVGSKVVSEKNMGICIAFLNSMNMLGGSFYHSFIGIAMDKFWRGEMAIDGYRVYDLEAYKYSLSIIPICACIGALLFVLLHFRRKIRN